MFLTYFLQFYVPIQILLPPLLNKWQKRNGSCFEYTFRTVLVLFTGEFYLFFLISFIVSVKIPVKVQYILPSKHEYSVFRLNYNSEEVFELVKKRIFTLPEKSSEVFEYRDCNYL